MPHLRSDSSIEYRKKEIMKQAADLRLFVLSLIARNDRHHNNITKAKVVGYSASAVGSATAVVGASLTLTGVFAPVGIPILLAGIGVSFLALIGNTGADVARHVLTNLSKLVQQLCKLNEKLEEFEMAMMTHDEWEMEKRELNALNKFQWVKIKGLRRRLLDFDRKLFGKKPEEFEKTKLYGKYGVAGATIATGGGSVGSAIKNVVDDAPIIKGGVLSSSDFARGGAKVVAKTAGTTLKKAALSGGIAFSALGIVLDVGLLINSVHHLRSKKGHEKSEGLEALADRLGKLSRWDLSDTRMGKDPKAESTYAATAARIYRTLSDSDLPSVCYHEHYWQRLREQLAGGPTTASKPISHKMSTRHRRGFMQRSAEAPM